MDTPFTLIGYGEAGGTFSRAGGWHEAAQVFDLKPLAAAYADDGVKGCDTLSQALTGSSAVLSLVTADQALVAAQNAAQHIAPGTLFLDMNSVAPDTKRQAAAVIAAAGARYVDVAIMAPVNPARLKVPLLVSGPDAGVASAWLETLGFSNVRIVGDDIGRASTIKMLRSVIYKGMEALTAECLLACAQAGVTDEVIASFGEGWSTQANYRLDRMMVHGARRSAEMAEAVKTLESLGVAPLMTRGTVERQAAIGALQLGTPPEDLNDKLERLHTQ